MVKGMSLPFRVEWSRYDVSISACEGSQLSYFLFVRLACSDELVNDGTLRDGCTSVLGPNGVGNNAGGSEAKRKAILFEGNCTEESKRSENVHQLSDITYVRVCTGVAT
jgi:hypothetical protein